MGASGFVLGGRDAAVVAHELRPCGRAVGIGLVVERQVVQAHDDQRQSSAREVSRSTAPSGVLAVAVFVEAAMPKWGQRDLSSAGGCKITHIDGHC